MLRASIITTSHVGTYDGSKQFLTRSINEGPILWTFCGFASALVTTTVAAPVDIVRTRQMLSPRKTSAVSIAHGIIQKEGLRGLFKGWLPSFYRFGPHFTI